MILLQYNNITYNTDGKQTNMPDNKAKAIIVFDDTGGSEIFSRIHIKEIITPKTDAIYVFETEHGYVTVFYDNLLYVVNMLAHEEVDAMSKIYNNRISINAEFLLSVLENTNFKKHRKTQKQGRDPYILIKPSLIAFGIAVLLYVGAWGYSLNTQHTDITHKTITKKFYIDLEKMMTEKAGGILNGLNPTIYKKLLYMSLRIPAYRIDGYSYENIKITGNKDKQEGLNIKVTPEFDVYVDGRNLEKFGETIRDGISYSVKIKL